MKIVNTWQEDKSKGIFFSQSLSYLEHTLPAGMMMMKTSKFFVALFSLYI